MNARTFVGSISSSCEMRPRRCADLTATAVPKSCAQRMNDGASSFVTAYLLPINNVALQSMYLRANGARSRSRREPVPSPRTIPVGGHGVAASRRRRHYEQRIYAGVASRNGLRLEGFDAASGNPLTAQMVFVVDDIVVSGRAVRSGRVVLVGKRVGQTPSLAFDGVSLGARSASLRRGWAIGALRAYVGARVRRSRASKASPGRADGTLSPRTPYEQHKVRRRTS